MSLNVKYEFWMEGYCIQGSPRIPAIYLGWIGHRGTFNEAFEEFFSRNLNDKRFGELDFRNGTPHVWGCQVFDNEIEARNGFG